MQNHPSPAPKLHHTQLSPELQFLIACCQTETTKDDIDLINSYINEGSEAKNAGTISSVIEMAGRHGVIPLVYKTLKMLSDNNLLMTKDDLIAPFQGAYMQIARRNMLMSAELLRIIKLLRENGIGVLAFKGPALAQNAYGDITLRQFGDLDILIKKGHALKALALLEHDGYLPEIMLSGSRKEAFFASVNVIGLEKTSRGLRTEVHWELISNNYAVTWNRGTLWSHSRSVLINNREVPVLSPEHQLLYLCIHGSKHLYDRLEWINDIDRTVRANPDLDWRLLFSEAEKMGTLRIILMSLWLCRELLALPLPADVHNGIDGDKTAGELGRRIVAMLSAETPSGKTYDSFGMLWRMRERFSDRIRFALRGLFSPKFDDFKFMALPKSLLFLYPAVRFFRLASKYFRR